jgi:signal transduction histidine kinase/CheY-like chemotaxis protein
MRKLKSRVFLQMVFYLAASAALFSTAYMWITIQSSNMLWANSIRERLQTLSDSAARLVTADELEQLYAPEDMQKPLYAEIKRRLVDFAADNRILYAYYARETGGEALQYIVDNDFNPGTVVDLRTMPIALNDTLKKALSGQRITLGLGEYVERSENLLSAFSPVMGKNGRVAAIAGVDIGDDQLILIQKRRSTITALLLISTGLAIASGFLNLAMYHRKTRQAEEASITKSEFLSSMSHEMRTPLNAIIGLSELMLAQKDIDEEPRENIEKVYNSGIVLLRIINDILDISKIESGKFELHPIEYDVPSLINDTITLNIMRIEDKPIHFALRVDNTLPSRLFGDDLRLKQIFNNILSNAFKYTKSGEVKWDISYERDGEKILLTSRVSDTGIGIRKEDIPKLFHRYTQVDAKANRKIEGTGLGLAITRRMVELMDGSIAVQSEYGKGSTFTVKIKQDIVSDVPIGEQTARALESFEYSKQKKLSRANLVHISLPHARILVVDDVPTNLDVARGMLKPYGMKIDCVTSGEAAVELIRDGVKYDAVFMDHMMPVMDGIEAVRIIREEIGTEYAKNIPIIALTANAIRGNDKIFLQNGFQAFLSKPIDVAQLDFVIRKWIRGNEAQKSAPRDALEQQCEQNSVIRNQQQRIAGLDWKEGVARFGGDEQTYLQVLNTFAVSTPPLLEQLCEAAKEDLTQYAVIAHGIKGSCRGICAEPLALQAEALERAAREGGLEFVDAHNSAFVAAARQLIADIESKKNARGLAVSALLAKLRQACLRYDMDSVDAVMEDLEKTQDQTGAELIAWLKERALTADFENIADRLA